MDLSANQILVNILPPLFHLVQKHEVKGVKCLPKFDLLKDPTFMQLDKQMRYGIIKNTINRHRSKKLQSDLNIESVELQIILNFFDLIVYDGRTVELAPRKSLKQPNPLKSFDDSLNGNGLIYCDEDSKDCVTLVVEEKEIHVNSFLLTNNSPVFKSMLKSTSFKEGQSKRIELPGKNYSEFLFFLGYLQSPQDIGEISGESLHLMC